LIAFPFVVALAFDVVRMVTAVPAPDLEVLEVGELRFEPEDPVFDLRVRAASDPRGWSEPDFALGPGWGETGPEGSWTARAPATLELSLAGSRQRVLFVEARVDRRREGTPALAVAVNGVDCGQATLSRRIEPLRFLLPDGAMEGGLDTVELRVVDPAGRPADDRTVLVRRVVVAGTTSVSFDELVAGPPLSIDRDRGTVSIRRPGRLVASFTTNSSGSELSCRIRFVKPRSRARVRVVVARRFEGPDRFDVISAKPLTASRPRTARIRQELTDRGESCALLVEVDRAAAEGGVVLSDLRVVAKPSARS